MEWWLFALLKIILINIILSGDNALVIAMASQHLPDKQKKLAIFWGAFVAIALRVILTIGVIQLLNIPYLMAIGSVLLFWIAVKLVKDDQEVGSIPVTNYLHHVIMTIILADFIMSLDNVLAVAAIAQGNILLICIGIILSIPLILWGSNMIVGLLQRFPWLIYIGAAILAFTAGDMFVRDNAISAMVASKYAYYTAYFLPFILAVIVILIPFFVRMTNPSENR